MGLAYFQISVLAYPSVSASSLTMDSIKDAHLQPRRKALRKVALAINVLRKRDDEETAIHGQH